MYIRKKALSEQEAKVGMRVYYIPNYFHHQLRWEGVEVQITRIENIGELCCELDGKADFTPLGNLFPILHSPHYLMRKYKNQVVYLADVLRSNGRLKLSNNLTY